MGKEGRGTEHGRWMLFLYVKMKRLFAMHSRCVWPSRRLHLLDVANVVQMFTVSIHPGSRTRAHKFPITLLGLLRHGGPLPLPGRLVWSPRLPCSAGRLAEQLSSAEWRLPPANFAWGEGARTCPLPGHAAQGARQERMDDVREGKSLSVPLTRDKK